MSEIQYVLSPTASDVGFPVQRLLPAAQVPAVGPFVFFDHMGPARFAREGTAGDVRPHPHIGLATVTYLYAGALIHRDSLGSVQRIDPGAINLMAAGRGIVHSERVPTDIRAGQRPVHGIQIWLALPAEREEMAPAFHHYPAEVLPAVTAEGVALRVSFNTSLPPRFCLTTYTLNISPPDKPGLRSPASSSCRQSSPDRHYRRRSFVDAGGRANPSW